MSEKKEIRATVNDITPEMLMAANRMHSDIVERFYGIGVFRLPFVGKNIFNLPQGTIAFEEVSLNRNNQILFWESGRASGFIQLHAKSGIFNFVSYKNVELSQLSFIENLIYDATCIMATLWLPGKKKGSKKRKSSNKGKNPDNGVDINTVYSLPTNKAASNPSGAWDVPGVNSARKYTQPSWLRRGYTRYDGIRVSPCVNNRNRFYLDA